MRSSLCAIIISMVMSASALAQGLPSGISPSMIETLKRMPAEQQKALAEQYGIDLPQSVAPSIATEAVTPMTNIGQVTEPEQQVVSAPKLQKTSRVYGANIFNRNVSTFAPTDNAPVPDDYRIGPGDQLVVQLFGGDNNTLYLDVSRNGVINFPDLGPITLTGLSFSETRELLQQRINQEFVGVSSVITLGNMRAINVFMAGEVAVPGAYSISALSTITQALFVAGGPNDLGSLRRIELKRNNKTVAEFDLYDLLMRGDASKDIRLNSGDILFIPPHVGLVEVTGAVKRPFIFEMKKGETLSDLINFAGGFSETAFQSSLQLERVGQEGLLAQVLTLDFNAADDTAIMAGDHIVVPESSDYLENAIVLKGAVVRPGNYQWRPGLRVSDLLGDARSMLNITADKNYALIVRTINKELDIDVLQFDLSAALDDADSIHNLPLQARDEVLIFNQVDLQQSDDRQVEGVLESADTAENQASRRILLAPVIEKLQRQARSQENVKLVSIAGAVKSPGMYPLTLNLDIRGLVAAAGGFQDLAYRQSGEYRELFEVNGEIKVTVRDIDLGPDGENLPLKSRDFLFVRAVAKWNDEAMVTVAGEVKFPGKYRIEDGEKLSSVLRRAGGLTSLGFAEGAVLTRRSVREAEQERGRELLRQIQKSFATSLLTQEENKVVDLALIDKLEETIAQSDGLGRLVIDLPAIIDGDSEQDIEMRDGDQISVPIANNTITIVGEVARPGSYNYERKFGVDTYLDMAAGETARANLDGVYIVKPNGRVATKKRNIFGIKRHPKLMAGDTIVVPLNTNYRDSLPLWRDVTAIIYQTVVSLAALAAI